MHKIFGSQTESQTVKQFKKYANLKFGAPNIFIIVVKEIAMRVVFLRITQKLHGSMS